MPLDSRARIGAVDGTGRAHAAAMITAASSISLNLQSGAARELGLQLGLRTLNTCMGTHETKLK